MHTLTLPLETNKQDDAILYKRFGLIAKLHNHLVKAMLPRLKRLKKNKWYKKKLGEYTTAKKRVEFLEKQIEEQGLELPEIILRAYNKELSELKPVVKNTSDELKEYRERIGVTKSFLEQYVKKFQHQYSHHISSHIAQKEANNVWAAVEEVLFGDGEIIHFKKTASFRTIASKSAKNGICFYDKKAGVSYAPKSTELKHERGVIFLGLDLAVSRPLNAYEIASLQNKVKTCAVMRKMFSSGWKYYLILTLEGFAPKKFVMGRNTAGIDPGVSSFAYASDEHVVFEELSPRCKTYNKEIAALQRTIDRSMREMNPDNYNSDGTVKKGKHKWVISNRCKRLKRKLATLYRKKSEYTKHEHNHRANLVIQDSSVCITEAMNFKALAKKAKSGGKQDKVTEIKCKDGTVKTVRKNKKRKRFGKSLNDRSPSLQQTIIKNKLAQYGGLYYEVDTKSFKASQYDHIKDEFIKVTLSTRFKDVGGHQVQRDLYSAFLLKNTAMDMKHTNRADCIASFDGFLMMHDKCIADLKNTGFHMPACVGF